MGVLSLSSREWNHLRRLLCLVLAQTNPQLVCSFLFNAGAEIFPFSRLLQCLGWTICPDEQQINQRQIMVLCHTFSKNFKYFRRVAILGDCRCSFSACKSGTTSGRIHPMSANKLSSPFLASQWYSEAGTVTEQATAAATCLGLLNRMHFCMSSLVCMFRR